MHEKENKWSLTQVTRKPQGINKKSCQNKTKGVKQCLQTTKEYVKYTEMQDGGSHTDVTKTTGAERCCGYAHARATCLGTALRKSGSAVHWWL